MQHPLKLNRIMIVPLLLAVTLAVSARADETTEKGRDIFKKNQHAVVTVSVVQKMGASGRSAAREAKQEVTGTVVDPSGLTVVALSSCDPAELYRRMSEDYKTEIEVSDVKILMEDGSEIPAEIVLRDKDLDLAFIRPKTKPASPMAAVDLTKSAHAQTLDELVTLNRLKRAAGRAFSASFERISAVVQKPRTFYIPDNTATETALGSPAFALDGGVVGLIVMRAVSAQGSSNARDCMIAIILPAEDIAKAAAQAPTEVKPDEEKKEVVKDATKDSTAKPETAEAPKVPAK